MSSYKWFLFYDLETFGETIIIKIETTTKQNAWNRFQSIVKNPDDFFLGEIREIRECWLESSYFKEKDE